MKIQRQYLQQLSPPDSRDYKLDKILTGVSIAATPITDTFKLPYFGKVNDQGSIGSCVAFSIAEERATTKFYRYLMKVYNYTNLPLFLLALAYGVVIPSIEDLTHYVDFSIGFVYGNKETTVTESHSGDGMYPRFAFQTLLTDGDVHLVDFPENEKYAVVRPLFLARQEKLLPIARINKIGAFAGLLSVEEIKIALKNIGVVQICIPVYPSFENVGADGIIPIPNRKLEDLIGYHQMNIYGFENNMFDTLNHWGKEWGDKGWCHIPFGFFEAEDVYSEMWSISDIAIEIPVINVPAVVIPVEPVVEPVVISNSVLIFLKKLWSFIIGIFKR